MDESEWLAERFEEHRAHLRAVAYRMLSSVTEAEDAVQDAWLRLSRSGAGEVENLGGWLTTVVARVCLNMLRARNVRREESLEVHLPDPVISPEGELQPEEEAMLADSVGLNSPRPTTTKRPLVDRLSDGRGSGCVWPPACRSPERSPARRAKATPRT